MSVLAARALAASGGAATLFAALRSWGVVPALRVQLLAGGASEPCHCPCPELPGTFVEALAFAARFAPVDFWSGTFLVVCFFVAVFLTACVGAATGTYWVLCVATPGAAAAPAAPPAPIPPATAGRARLRGYVRDA